jgi:hypothetical protein
VPELLDRTGATPKLVLAEIRIAAAATFCLAEARNPWQGLPPIFVIRG